MGKRLEDLISSGLAIRKGTWYYIKEGNIKLGNSSDKAEATLDELNYIKPQTEQPDKPKTLEAIKKNTEEESFYESLVGDLQDIKSFRREGVYNVYIFGIDSRLDKEPVVKSCPFVFSWRKATDNVKSGTTIINNGWTVLSRTKIKPDPRTGKPWITTSRDDSPGEDYIRVGSNVLCYADKKAWNKMQADEIAKNITRTGEMSDQRTEHARNMAALSKEDVTASFQGFKSSNTSERSRAVEYVAQGSEAKKAEADAIMADLDNLGAGDSVDQIEARLSDLRQKVESGQTSNSILGSTKISIDSL